MSKKTSLRDAIGSIQPNKPLILPKDQTFSAPQSHSNEPSLPSNQQTQGNSPRGEQPGGRLPEGHLPEGQQPLGNLPPGNLPGGDSPRGRQSEEPEISSQTPAKDEDQATDETSAERPGLSDDYDAVDYRVAKRRKNLLNSAVQLHAELSQQNQALLVKSHLAEGWGRLAHCVTHALKAPTRFRLKLVDIALIVTIYDKTIAQVNPRMYAPISAEEFRTETGMDVSNIRIGLKSLVERKAVLKLSTAAINFWALNHAYFSTLGAGILPPGKRPPGKSPGGKVPAPEQGNLPGGEGGQITRGDDNLTPGNHDGMSVPKNLIQESEEESLSQASKVPEDMQIRWRAFEKSGKYSNAKKEREIFEELLTSHKEEFFLNCWKVVQFLEEQGNGKSGQEGKVYNPMAYLKGHWEHNLNRYQSWIQEQEGLKVAAEKKAKAEAKEKEEQIFLKEAHEKDLQSQLDQEAQMQRDIQRLLQLYRNESELNAFVEKAVVQSQCAFTLSSWRKQGWESPVVKCCVISHFLELEKSMQLN